MWRESATTGLQTLQGFISNLHGSILSLLSSWILTSMGIRDQLFTETEMDPDPASQKMRIQANLHPQPFI